MKKFVIIGLGSFGINMAKSFSENKNIEVIAIDKDEQKINEIKDIVAQPITMDATNKDNLLSMGIKESDCVIVSTGPELESSILIVHLLSQLEIPRIIAKALSEDHEKILYLVGATEVYYPEKDVAQKIGKRLTVSNLLDYLPLESGHVVQEIAPPEKFIGKSIGEIDMRKKYKVTVILVESIIPEATIINPGADFIIKESDILFVFGHEKDIAKLHE